MFESFGLTIFIGASAYVLFDVVATIAHKLSQHPESFRDIDRRIQIEHELWIHGFLTEQNANGHANV